MTREDWGPSRWELIVAQRPEHSQWYIERFRAMEREGADIVGEARLADAMVERGSRVLLFVREYKTDRLTGGAEAYTFLGSANYVRHEGSRPMNIIWQLDRPIPAKFLKKTNKLAAG